MPPDYPPYIGPPMTGLPKAPLFDPYKQTTGVMRPVPLDFIEDEATEAYYGKKIAGLDFFDSLSEVTMSDIEGDIKVIDAKTYKEMPDGMYDSSGKPRFADPRFTQSQMQNLAVNRPQKIDNVTYNKFPDGTLGVTPNLTAYLGPQFNTTADANLVKGLQSDLNIPIVDPSTKMTKPSLSANLGGRGMLDSGTGVNDTFGVDVPAKADSNNPTGGNRQEVRSLPVHQMSKIGHAVLAARNHFQAPPPSVQVARTHLERNTFDDRLYEEAKDNAQASAVASMEMMRGQISNPADLMRAAHAVTQGTQDAVANIDMQRAAAKQQVLDSNVAIANQEQQMQDQQNTQEMLINYQNMQQFAREKTQAVSAELSNVEQAFMNEANYLETKEAMMKQRAIDKQYRDEKLEVDIASMEILSNKGFESTEGYAEGRLDFKAAKRLEAEEATRQDLGLGDDFTFNRNNYKLDINKYQKGMVEAAQNEATLKAFQKDLDQKQADLDALDPNDAQFADKQKYLIEQKDAAQQEYDNRSAAQDKYKQDLTALKSSIDTGGEYFTKFQELYGDDASLNEAYRSQYMKDRGIRPDREIIDNLYDRLKNRRDVEKDIVRPDLGQ